jgi:hypothetical protein
MAQFSSIVDFNGFYTGSYDGRQAEVEIVVSHPIASQPIGLTEICGQRPESGVLRQFTSGRS